MKKGFTILEMITVFAVIIIIASFATSHMVGIMKRKGRDRARADITRLEAAINAYFNDFGEYPPQGAPYNLAQVDNINLNLVRYLTSYSTYGGSARWRGPYIKFDSKQLDAGRFVDPWRHSYLYHSQTPPALNNPAFVDIISMGPDEDTPPGNPGTGTDDIINWKN